jgi:hypothetical protein
VVEGKFFPRLESDDLIPANFELDSALLTAETAVRLDELFCRISRFILPSTRRNIRRMRAKTIEQ